MQLELFSVHCFHGPRNRLHCQSVPNNKDPTNRNVTGIHTACHAASLSGMQVIAALTCIILSSIRLKQVLSNLSSLDIFQSMLTCYMWAAGSAGKLPDSRALQAHAQDMLRLLFVIHKQQTQTCLKNEERCEESLHGIPCHRAPQSLPLWPACHINHVRGRLGSQRCSKVAVEC